MQDKTAANNLSQKQRQFSQCAPAIDLEYCYFNMSMEFFRSSAKLIKSKAFMSTSFGTGSPV